MPENELMVVEPDVTTLDRPRSYGDLLTLAESVTSTALCPAAYKGKPEDAAIAMMMAVEVGINPVTSLNFIATINGRPSWYADALPGIAKSRGMITGYQERFDGKEYDDDFKAICEVHTPDGLTYTNEFSVADAKRAKLWGKSGPWQLYPKRMLQWRSRSYAIRDACPEMLFGATVEELRDEESRHRGPERAKDITVDTSAPKRRIVTMTGPAEEVDETPPDAAPESKPKSIRDMINHLANTDSVGDVDAIDALLDERRGDMSENQIAALETAIQQARSRLMPSSDTADVYASRILEGGDLSGVKAEIESDDALSKSDKDALLVMIDTESGVTA